MNFKGSILIVEDDFNLGNTLCDYLQSKGFSTYLADCGKKAKELFVLHSPILILMDIGLPDTSGLVLAKEFRKLRKDFFLLFLSAQNDPEIRVQGLEIGAEDYITKPFALRELILRLERVFKSKNNLDHLPDKVSFGPLSILFKSFELIGAKGNKIPISQKECGILEVLYNNKNKAVTREDIIDAVWGKEIFPSNRTVDNYIVKLRKWAETDLKKSVEIQSIRGIGYKLAIS